MNTKVQGGSGVQSEHLGEGLVEVGVLIVAHVGGAAQPQRLVVVEQVPVPHRLLHLFRLGRLLLLVLVLIVCAQLPIISHRASVCMLQSRSGRR